MILLLALIRLAAAVPAPVPLDSSLVQDILRRKGIDLAVPATSDWMLVGPVDDSAVLLAQGSEFVRIPWDASLESTRSEGALVGASWQDRLLRWSAPQEDGGSAWLGYSQGTAASSIPVAGIHLGGRMVAGWSDWIRVGAGYEAKWATRSPAIAIVVGDTVMPLDSRYSFELCGPVLCGEMVHHAVPIGEDTWYQNGLDRLLLDRQRGEFWTATGDSGFGGAWETRLTAHLGAARYQYRVCPGLWNGPIQSLGIHDLQVGAVSMGAGMEWTPGIAVTWFEVGASRWGFSPPLLDILGGDYAWIPFRSKARFRSVRQFAIQIETVLEFPSPLIF